MATRAGALALASALSAGALSAATDLDPTYATNGRYEYTLAADSSTIQASALQTNGATVHVGRCPAGVASQPCAFRLTANGVFDEGFGTGAIGQPRLLAGMGSATAVAVDSRGRIITVGECNDAMLSVSAMCAQRRLSDGSIDASFAGGTKLVLELPGSFATSVLIDPDDKVVLAGQCDGSNWCIARLTVSGGLDASFGGGDGFRIRTWPQASASSAVRTLLRDASGNYIAVGICRVPQPGLRACVSGFAANGDLVSAYGIEPFAMGRDTTRVVAAGFHANGALVLMGYCADASVVEFCLALVTSGGSLDASFGNQGRVQTLVLTSSTARAGAIQEDGRIVVAGICSGRACAVRYEINGALDRSFADNGAFFPAGSSPTEFVTTEFVTLKIDALNRWVVGALCRAPNFDGIRQCVQRMKGGPTDYARCSLDIDGDGVVASETDIALLSRSTMGFVEDAVVDGLSIASHARRRGAPGIRRFLMTHCNLRLP